MSGSGLEQLLGALTKLAPTPAVTFRGLPAGSAVPPGLGALTLPVPTTGEPSLAVEGDPVTTLLVLLTRTGRSLAALSGAPQERETVLLPGTVWRVVTLAAPRPGVLVLEELDTTGQAPAPAAWPATLADLEAAVASADARATAAGPVPARGKFRGEWPAQPLVRP